MSPREKIIDLIDIINPKDLDEVYKILEQFAFSSVPNDETSKAMEDARNNENLSVAFTSVDDLMEALNADD